MQEAEHNALEIIISHIQTIRIIHVKKYILTEYGMGLRIALQAVEQLQKEQ